jgi:predicted CoA-substrate-specific enzyme activase
MLFAGIDVGSLTAKAAILNEGEIVSWSVIPTGPDSVKAARDALEKARTPVSLEMSDLNSIVATGYGRENVDFSSASVTEISCHAKGTWWFRPEVRTILDMGGQDCKAISCDGEGRVLKFVMNDKCAAGTGRYLERVARALEMPLEEIGPTSLNSTSEPVKISAYCTVFAEQEAWGLVRRGVDSSAILAGAFDALVRRIKSLLARNGGIEEEFAISGGVAKNVGIVSRVETVLGVKAQLAFEPQIVGAVGAAVFAKELALTGAVVGGAPIGVSMGAAGAEPV